MEKLPHGEQIPNKAVTLCTDDILNHLRDNDISFATRKKSRSVVIKIKKEDFSQELVRELLLINSKHVYASVALQYDPEEMVSIDISPEEISEEEEIKAFLHYLLGSRNNKSTHRGHYDILVEREGEVIIATLAPRVKRSEAKIKEHTQLLAEKYNEEFKDDNSKIGIASYDATAMTSEYGTWEIYFTKK